MVIIDWELCGYGDAYFDLARIPYLRLPPFDEEKLMLTEYFGFFGNGNVEQPSANEICRRRL